MYKGSAETSGNWNRDTLNSSKDTVKKRIKVEGNFDSGFNNENRHEKEKQGNEFQSERNKKGKKVRMDRNGESRSKNNHNERRTNNEKDFGDHDLEAEECENDGPKSFDKRREKIGDKKKQYGNLEDLNKRSKYNEKDLETISEYEEQEKESDSYDHRYNNVKKDEERRHPESLYPIVQIQRFNDIRSPSILSELEGNESSPIVSRQKKRFAHMNRSPSISSEPQEAEPSPIVSRQKKKYNEGSIHNVQKENRPTGHKRKPTIINSEKLESHSIRIIRSQEGISGKQPSVSKGNKNNHRSCTQGMYTTQSLRNCKNIKTMITLNSTI